MWRSATDAGRGATVDPVTGLPNRRQLLLALPRAIASATEAAPIALVLLDLNGFKAYNDRFGHQAGDKLLQLLARRLEACVASAGTGRRTAWAAASSASSRRSMRSSARTTSSSTPWQR